MGSRFVMLLLSFSVFVAAVGYSGDPADQDQLDLFGRELEDLRGKLRLPGMAAAIVKNRKVVWVQGFGYADLENGIEVTPDTPFRLASVTKTYASTILMRLVEQGHLDLDDPVSKFGIELQSRGTITVRHLFSHTSEGNPGSSYKYSGDRYSLLDRVVEHTTGRSFAVNLEELIITPLGLKNTAVGAEGLAVPLAKPYSFTKDQGFRLGKYPQHFSSAAGLMASVTDVATFDVALDQHRFIGPETQDLAWMPTVSTRGRILPYGLGWFSQTCRGTRLVWHYGWWPPHVSSLYLKVPEHNLSFIILANSDALSAKFKLDRGNVLRSPAAKLFLKTFVF
jgi:CubicO group peptidase (beta-lactamase class C family)